MTHEEFLEAWGMKPIYNKDGKEVYVDAYCRSSGNTWDQNSHSLGKIDGLTTEKPVEQPRVIKLTDTPHYELHLFKDGSFKFGHIDYSDTLWYNNDPQNAYERTGERGLDTNLKKCIDALVKLVRENC